MYTFNTLKLELYSGASLHVQRDFSTSANCSVSSPLVPNFFALILLRRFRSACGKEEKQININLTMNNAKQTLY